MLGNLVIVLCTLLAGHVAAAKNTSDGPHRLLFRLEDSAPVQFDGGDLRGAHEENWPALVGQNGSVYVVSLEPGALREPHWHPSAWELNYVISGEARWTLLGPKGIHDSFAAHAGEVVFAPQGHLHYFENAGTEPLKVLVVFNTGSKEPDDDIGMAASLAALPNDVLGAILGVDHALLEKVLPKVPKPVVITRKKKTS